MRQRGRGHELRAQVLAEGKAGQSKVCGSHFTTRETHEPFGSSRAFVSVEGVLDHLKDRTAGAVEVAGEASKATVSIVPRTRRKLPFP